MRKKGLWGLLCILVLVLAACGTGQAKKTEKKVAPLETTTTLSSKGIISADQMKTIVGKNQSYTFKGSDNGISYQWIYQGRQVQNPVKQNLKVSFDTENLTAVKKAANNASEALGVTIGKMQLAGAPQLVVQIPKKWSANKVVLVREVDGKLKKTAGSTVDIKQTEQQTTLTFRVLESNVHYYLVGGNQTGEQTVVEGDEATTTSVAASEKTATSANPDQQQAAQTNGNVVKAGKTSTKTKTGTQQAATSSSATSQSGTTGSSAATTKAQTQTQTETGTSNGQQTTQKKEQTVTFSISSATILNNWSDLKKEKQPYAPKDGWIVKPTTVSFKDGDSVYDILVKVTKEQNIQMESRWTPMYNAYYVAGIHQLYEFDCGNLSGWMYEVNGWFPNYGCSKYTDLHDGDTINWKYTCDLGKDLGAGVE